MSVHSRDVLKSILQTGRWPTSFAPESRIRDIASGEVPEAVDEVGFEVRLDVGEDVDFGVAMNAPGTAPLPIARSESVDRSGRNSAAWRQVLGFYDRWSTPGSVESGTVPHAFLEFDTSEGTHRLADPSLFFGLYVHDDRRLTAIVCELLANTFGHPIDDQTKRTLESCLARLPESSLLLHVGIMLGRSERVRLHARLPGDSTGEYLRGIGFDCDLREIDHLLTRFGMGEPWATLQLEIGKTVTNAIGLEFADPGGAAEESDARWMASLERFHESGLCTSDRLEALRAWPTRYRSRVGRWPCTISQQISHVKLTLRPDRPLRAKAYLSVTPSLRLFGSS